MSASDEYSHYNPVDVQVKPKEVMGTFFLGVLSLILLVSYMRSQRRLLALQAELLQKNGELPAEA